MAGMLPGVECARRRRFYGNGSPFESAKTAPDHRWTRRPSFCLYTSSLETHHPSLFFSRDKSNKAHCEGDLKPGGGAAAAAREAKERLDERLRTRTRSKRAPLFRRILDNPRDFY